MNIQLGTLKTEVGKGSMRTAIGHGIVDSKRQEISYNKYLDACFLKENVVNILQPGCRVFAVT